ncbi:RNA polymerase sigma factor [Fulvivirgaceae bacterium BMA10]|uniref:RNA polymerase sigma factor n=1 Tax=Splendidivirga corallicola TaxID=3051826 RepID=A0ABT8KQ93_9BACT|nr:RNA polymerase sigma factor [Fulvivirgaceae bacterium BMA10]
MKLEEERELVWKAKKNPKAFGQLYDLYYPRIFGYVYRRVADFDIARDVTSEVFLKAFLNIHKFRWKGISISSWFYRIATHEVNSTFRKKKYSPDSLNQLLDQVGYEMPDPSSLENEKLEIEREIKEYSDFLQIQTILSRLSVKYQEVVALRYFEQKSIKEICEILDKKEGTVKSLISRGLEHIRKKL